MNRRVVCVMDYKDGGPIVDFVKVSWNSRERWATYCRECNQVVELNMVDHHKQTMGHKPTHCIAVPEPHRHTNWCSPICGLGRIAAPKPRKVGLIPVQVSVYAGPTMCFFGIAHSGGTQTTRCRNCGATVSPLES